MSAASTSAVDVDGEISMIDAEEPHEGMQCDSTKRKRRRKMNKHKLGKLRRKNRFKNNWIWQLLSAFVPVPDIALSGGGA